MNRSTALREYPLWLAHYSIDPAVTTNQPNAKSVGCYADSWTNQIAQPNGKFGSTPRVVFRANMEYPALEWTSMFLMAIAINS
ncbi:MAG: hypothetical protein WDN07_01890 [Actinomycetota bacterium]